MLTLHAVHAGHSPMITAVLWREMLDRGGGIRGRRCLGWCRLQRREVVLHEPHALECQADRLLAVLPRRMVHHGTTHMGHRRDGGQFHQPFPLNIAVEPFKNKVAPRHRRGLDGQALHRWQSQADADRLPRTSLT